MTSRSTRTPLFLLAALALSGSIALSQQTPPQPTPAPSPDAPPPAAAPIERKPPSDTHMAPGTHQGMPLRPGMMQRNGSGDLRGAAMMHNRDGFRGGSADGVGSAFHIVPPGMWWKNPAVVQRLTLTPDQTRKMDDVFQQSRLQLIDLKANVERQQVLLEPMLSANPVETSKAMAQIDKVAQARADLEKAHARMLLGIRGVLTPDQWTNLNSHLNQGGFGPHGGPGEADAQGDPGRSAGRGHGPRGGGTPLDSNNPAQPVPQP